MDKTTEKPMKRINILDVKEMQTRLDVVQKGARERKYTAMDVCNAGNMVRKYLMEKWGLTKTRLKGCLFTFGHHAFSKKYEKLGSPKGTVITLAFGTDKIYMVKCDRTYCNEPYRNGVILTDAAREAVEIKAVNEVHGFMPTIG